MVVTEEGCDVFGLALLSEPEVSRESHSCFEGSNTCLVRVFATWLLFRLVLCQRRLSIDSSFGCSNVEG